jgi:fibronectin type 3 domain-containing protein
MLIFSIICFIPRGNVHGGPWTIEIVDGEGAQVGWDNSIAIDSFDRPHIAYFDETNDKLKYASWTGTQWINETVDYVFSVGGYCSLALDSNDYPHISYDDEQNDDLRYAFWNGSTWIRQTVDPVGLGAHYTSIALDSNDYPHICYNEWEDDELRYAHWNGTTWNITIVDSLNNPAAFCSIALDTNDRPHISYASDGNLNYTWWDGNSWNFDTVFTSGTASTTYITLDSGDNPHIAFHDSDYLRYAWYTGSWNFDIIEALSYAACLVLDSADKPHMSFCNALTRDLKYGSKTGASWNIQTLDSYGDVGRFTSIALDSSENPHIAYFNNTIYPGDLKYANWTGSKWNIMNVDFGNLDVGEYISLALDSNYIPHVAYKRRRSSYLRYANKTGGTWNWDIAANIGGAYTSIVMDGDDLPHISYMRNHSFTLRYVHWNGSEWNIQEVDGSNNVGKFSSIALNESDYPRIAYYDEWNSNLKYAEWTGSIWAVSFVDPSGTVGGHCSMALDSSYTPSISYYKATTGDLMYARWNGFSWSKQTIDSAGDVGKFTSIVLDTNDYPHISYYDIDNKVLKYAWWNGSAWSNEVVDPTFEVGYYTSIDLDTMDRPHISYYDFKNGDLKVASLNGSWTYEVLDSVGDVGRYTSLKIDGSNFAHIAYFDVTQYEVKYAKSSLGILPPGALEDLVAFPNGSNISLSWQDPGEDGGSPIIGYNIYRNGTIGVYDFVPVGQLWYNDGNITTGTEYSYWVTPVNSVGEGLSSNEASATFYSTPSSVTDVVSSSGDQYVNITWSVPSSDGGSAILFYNIYRNGTTIPYDTVPASQLWFNDTSVLNSVTYTYNISAENAIGEGPTSVDVIGTPDNPFTFPSEPQNPQISAGDSVINLTWDVPSSNGGSVIIEYNIYRNGTSGVYATVPSGQLWYLDASVINGIQYTYNITAVNIMGEGPRSNDVSTTPMAVPSEVQNLQAESGLGYVNLTWNVPLDGGGSSIIQYNIYRNGTTGVFDTVLASQLWYNDTSVLTWVTYTYNVSSQNVVGEGPVSGNVFGTPVGLITVPSEPQNPQILGGDSFINLTWDLPFSDGGSSIIEYNIYRNGTSGVYATVSSGQLWYLDNDVINGVTYTYNISAVNSVGEGRNTDDVSATPLTLPTKVQNLHVDPGANYVNLTWLAPSDNGGSLITGYNIYRNDTIGVYSFVPSGRLWYNDTNVINGINYEYRISAITNVGEGPISEGVIAIPFSIPGAPQNLAADPGTGYITLSWTDPVDDGGSAITNYRIYKGEVQGEMIFLNEVGNIRSYNDSNVSNGITYYYMVAAVNGAGEGVLSSERNATWINKIPICQISYPSTGTSISGTIGIMGTSSDNDGTVQWVEIRIDNGSWIKTDGTDSWLFILNTTSYLDGEHIIYIRSYDGFEYSNEVSVNVIVDNHPSVESKGETEGNNWLWVFIAVVMVLIILLLLLMIRKRKPKDGFEEELEEYTENVEIPESDSGEISENEPELKDD